MTHSCTSNGRKTISLISENDYKAIQNALESLSEYTLVRTLVDYKIAVEVTTAPNVWGNTDADSGKAMAQERVQYQKLCKRGGNEVVSWVSSQLASEN